MTSPPKPIEGRTQAEEMQLAYEENRQPLCVHCGHPIDKVYERQNDDITWMYVKDRGGYDKCTDGDSDGAEHVCEECPDGCHAKDDFVENDLINY